MDIGGLEGDPLGCVGGLGKGSGQIQKLCRLLESRTSGHQLPSQFEVSGQFNYNLEF